MIRAMQRIVSQNIMDLIPAKSGCNVICAEHHGDPPPLQICQRHARCVIFLKGKVHATCSMGDEYLAAKYVAVVSAGCICSRASASMMCETWYRFFVIGRNGGAPCNLPLVRKPVLHPR